MLKLTPMLRCCGLLLHTKRQVLKHYGTRPKLAGDGGQQFFYCNDHHGIYHSNCQHCVDAAFVNKIDRSLHKQGLILDPYVHGSENGSEE